MALLVAAEGLTCTGNGTPSPRAVEREQHLSFGVMVHRKQGARDAELPRGLDEPPTGLGLLRQVVGLVALSQVVERLGNADPGLAAALVGEEAQRHLVPSDDVERVDDVVEAKPHGGGDEGILIELARVRPAAGVEELAAPGGALLVGAPQVLADVGGEGSGELIKGDELPWVGSKVEEGAPKGELVGSHVPGSKHHDPAPVVLGARPIGDERLAHGLSRRPCRASGGGRRRAGWRRHRADAG